MIVFARESNTGLLKIGHLDNLSADIDMLIKQTD